MEFIGVYDAKIAITRKVKNQIQLVSFETYFENVKQLYTEKTEIITGLKSSEVMLRSLVLKLKSKREILAALPFQVENLFPYPEDELILLPSLYKKDNETEVFLFASTQKALEVHLEHLDFDPDQVSCIPKALFQFAVHFFPTIRDLFFQHENLFIVIQDQKLKSFHRYKEHELPRIIAFLQKKYPDIRYFLTTGKTSAFSHFIQLELDVPKIAEFAIPIGLSLEGAKKGTQFRQGPYQAPRKKRKQKKQLATYFSICLGLSLCIFFMGHVHLKKKEKAILTALEAPIGISLSKYVDQLEEDARTEKKASFPLSTVPKVSQVLTWLSTHPALKEDCSITQFRYQMVRAPKLGTTARKFEAKVEIELTTQNARAARAFHESLLSDRKMVNRKRDVNWSADYGVYNASFFLKENFNG